MALNEGERQAGIFGGVSLPSFLQMLEQERKSCTLIVRSEDREGRLYFNDGVLIDAQSLGALGREAAFAILSWENPSLHVDRPEDRMHRIRQPLAHILLDYATLRDEEGGAGAAAAEESAIPLFDCGSDHPDPVVRGVARHIVSIRGIRHYYFLNRQGNVITQSSRTLKLGDFITYCIVSGIQMRKVLDARGPSRIQLGFQNGETLLILPGAGMIIGLLLDGMTAVDEIVEQLRPALTGKAGPDRA
ncbi:MAG TPA: DUF4388 domain-containing protein [Desulfobacteraceae bacterium]|nr:DUF4388 domain-containing protein [Desulfobacteraceae bacterium]